MPKFAVVILETERLLLRTWTVDDAEAAFAIWGDPDVMRYVDDGKPFTDVDCVRRSLCAAQDVQEEHGHCLWAVVERSSDVLIGACGFHPFDDGLELAFHFARAYWGHGFATEAAMACINYGFRVLDTSRIVAAHHTDNVGSRRVLQKLKMVRIGLDNGEPLYEIQSWRHNNRMKPSC